MRRAAVSSTEHLCHAPAKKKYTMRDRSMAIKPRRVRIEFAVVRIDRLVRIRSESGYQIFKYCGLDEIVRQQLDQLMIVARCRSGIYSGSGAQSGAVRGCIMLDISRQSYADATSIALYNPFPTAPPASTADRSWN
jgi:hypothetical protein